MRKTFNKTFNLYNISSNNLNFGVYTGTKPVQDIKLRIRHKKKHVNIVLESIMTHKHLPLETYTSSMAHQDFIFPTH